MTPIEIAYLKHFLFDKDIARRYISFFKHYPLKGNPESIEQFFLQTTIEDVIMKAFTFFPSNVQNNKLHTYAYWKDIDDKWKEYMASNASNFSNESWPSLRKTFSILRQNWDLPQFFRRENLESTVEVYHRMNINMPLPEWIWKHGTGGMYGSNEEASIEPECPAVLPQEFPNDPLADFEFIEPLATAGYRLKRNEASLNFNNSCYKLTFNAHVSDVIINSGMSFAKLARNKAGDLCIILNRKDGSRLSKTLLSKGRRSNSVTINSKDVTTTVKTMLGIKTDYSVLTIERLDISLDYLIYKVKYTKQ